MKLYETITAENWCKEKMYDRVNGTACLHGHLARVYGEAEWIGPALKLYSAIRVLFPERGGGLIGFNDHPSTDVDDILRACKSAVV